MEINDTLITEFPHDAIVDVSVYEPNRDDYIGGIDPIDAHRLGLGRSVVGM